MDYTTGMNLQHRMLEEAFCLSCALLLENSCRRCRCPTMAKIDVEKLMFMPAPSMEEDPLSRSFTRRRPETHHTIMID